MESLDNTTKFLISAIVIPFCIILFILGCKTNTPFHKIKWQQKDDMEYPYRNAMLNDLLLNNRLSNLSKKEWSSLLGEPDGYNTDSLTAFYDIYLHYDVIDPDKGKELLLILNKDSSISNYRIYEWEKH